MKVWKRKWVPIVLFALVLALGVTFLTPTANVVQASTYSVKHVQVKTQPNTYQGWLIPDVNIWGSHTYLKTVDLTQTKTVYAQCVSVGDNNYYIQTWLVQDGQTTTDGPKYWSQDTVYDVQPGLQIYMKWINVPYTWGPGLYIRDGLWYPPEQVIV